MRIELTLTSVVAHMLVSVAGPYGFLTWLGKALAQLTGHDRTAWGDVGGIIGGVLDLAFFIGSVTAAATT